MTLTTSLQEVMEQVLNNQSVKDKISIYRTHSAVGNSVEYQDPILSNEKYLIKIGDDCAAIPDGSGGYLLFASEGIISSFVKSSPWFAGYSAVMVNISDICSMGGLPMAITDVVWLKDEEDGKEIWAGMKAASEAYGVPIVGGHTCYNSTEKQLAVSILGKAKNLLTSYDAKPGDAIMMAVDLNGDYFGSYPFWNASTTTSSARLKTIMQLPFLVAEKKLAHAAKDISMGGIVGTLAMLLHTSNVGANIKLDYLPKPPNVALEKWLVSFPSYGYLICVEKEKVDKIQSLFLRNDIACVTIGHIRAQQGMDMSWMGETVSI